MMSGKQTLIPAIVKTKKKTRVSRKVLLVAASKWPWRRTAAMVVTSTVNAAPSVCVESYHRILEHLRVVITLSVWNVSLSGQR